MAPSRFEVRTDFDATLKTEVIALHDTLIRSSAFLAPAVGNNLYSFRVPVNGQEVEAMIQAGDPVRPVGFGNPILFPFPNRIRDAKFSFMGKEYQLDKMGQTGLIMHGLVANKTWTVERAGATSGGAEVVSSLYSAEQPDIIRQFPFPFRVTVTYRLRGDTVRMTTEVENVGDTPMPMGLGIHPYFRLPLTPKSTRQESKIKIPAKSQWKPESDLIPRGPKIPLSEKMDFQALRPIGETTLDDVYADIVLTPGEVFSESILQDPNARVELAVRADPSFRENVVFAPPGRPFMCFEPYTCTTNAFNLQAEGVDAGMITLHPGEIWEGRIWFILRPSGDLSYPPAY